MKRALITVVSLLTFAIVATAQASGPDALRSPVATMIPPDAKHYTAQTMPAEWYHLRAVPLTAADWQAIGR